MAGRFAPGPRDRLVTKFRRFVYNALEFYPFAHQAEWQLASEGLMMTGTRARPYQPHITIRHRDKTLSRMAVGPRPLGVAKVLADMAAYKAGKSYGGAMWLAGFAAVPGARVDLIGLEYDIIVPEFEYLCDILLAAPPVGLGLPYTKLHNQSKAGRLLIELGTTGARFEGRSWERKEMLKGKERDCYYYCESYMFPGLTCYTKYSQNLRARKGFAIFTTTADRPWVTIFHEEGHGKRANWHCSCGAHAKENPYTYSQEEDDRDNPLIGGMMTAEQYAVSWEGKLGAFVGRVYSYQRGDWVMSVENCPTLWRQELVNAVLDQQRAEHV